MSRYADFLPIRELWTGVLIFGLQLPGLVPVLVRANEQAIIEADLTVSKDYGVTKPVITPMVPEDDLNDLTEKNFAKMSLDDIRLQTAYIVVFQSVDSRDPMTTTLSGAIAAARADLYRRGNNAAPLLLKFLRANPYSRIEGLIMATVGSIPRMELAPFVEQARVAVKERGMTMNPGNAGAIATFLVRNGDATDWDLLKKWAVDRPYLESVIKDTLTHGEWVRSQAYGPTMPKVRLRVEAGSAHPVPAAPPQREEIVAAAHGEGVPVAESRWWWWIALAGGGCLALVVVALILKRKR